MGRGPPRGDDMLWKFGLRKEECEIIYFSYFFATRKSGTMDPKILVKSSKIVGSAKIWIRQKNKKIV